MLSGHETNFGGFYSVYGCGRRSFASRRSQRDPSLLAAVHGTMSLAERLESPNMCWQCTRASGTKKGDELHEFKVGLLNHSETMERLQFMVVANPTGTKVQPKSLTELVWPRWTNTIWSTPISSWYSAPLIGKEFTSAFSNGGIAIAKTVLKQH